MRRLVFARLTYGPLMPKVVAAQETAAFHASIHAEVQWVASAAPDRMEFSAARNAVVEGALSMPGAEGVFWFDDDILPEVDTISKLLLQGGQHFTTGLYFQRHPPHWPLIARHDPYAKGRDGKGAMQWFQSFPDNVVAPIDACGFGCCYTSIALLKAVGPKPFSYGKFSEDFSFCLKAKDAGFQLYVNTGARVGHLSGENKVVTADDFFKVRDLSEAD